MFQQLGYFGIPKLSDLALKELQIGDNKEFERVFRILEEESFGALTAEIHQQYGSAAKRYVKNKDKGSVVGILTLLSAEYLAKMFPDLQSLILPKDGSVLKGGAGDLNTLFGFYEENYLSDVFPAIQHIIRAPGALSQLDELLVEFASVPEGTFLMGSPVEEMNRSGNEIQRHVTLSAFEIAATAVTQELYARVMGVNPSQFAQENYCQKSFKILEINGQKIPVCADHPIESVSWNDANDFIAKLNSTYSDYQYQLPTEAQLEYSFRGGTTTAYVSGSTESGIEEFAWFRTNSNGQTHPVKSKRRNAFGVYRSGLWEWTKDDCNDLPLGAVSRPSRGGSWFTNVHCCRSACRSIVFVGSKSNTNGIRLIRTPKY